MVQWFYYWSKNNIFLWYDFIVVLFSICVTIFWLLFKLNFIFWVILLRGQSSCLAQRYLVSVGSRSCLWVSFRETLLGPGVMSSRYIRKITWDPSHGKACHSGAWEKSIFQIHPHMCPLVGAWLHEWRYVEVLLLLVHLLARCPCHGTTIIPTTSGSN